MVQIGVNSDLAKRIEASRDAVEIVDECGRRIGLLARPFSNEDIAEARLRSKSKASGHTTAEVLARIKKMESA